ncbi:MAG: 4-hydroxy-tetrahydrodipicolinate synthase [Pseudomonadales bacterium]|nr:4-hydroxy-tetrahydrodipicolinate synthase [Pseudomonadales bacterium]
MFSGSIAALITPFTDNAVDESALARLVRFHIDNGTHGLVAAGTTGEAPTLSRQEHERVIDVVVYEAGGQLPVIAGAGSNNPVEAIELTRYAIRAGATATLHALGYYNRPGQAGILAHFRALSDATEGPILVYNIPPRAIIDITPETMAQLAELPDIVGVKDATSDLSRPLRERALAGEDFCLLSGEDITAVAYNANGGQGCISVTANLAPALCAQMQTACAAGNYAVALEIQHRLLPLHQALFAEPSPAGVKYAASLMGLSRPDCRLPMVPLTRTTQRQVQNAMADLGLI